MTKSAVSKVTSKGQVTIPESIREYLHVGEGDRVEWSATTPGVVKIRKAGGDLRSLVGILGTPARSLTLADIDEVIRQRGRRGARR